MEIPDLVVRDTDTGLPVGMHEHHINAEFAKYDVDGSGSLSYDEAKALFRTYETFGVPLTDTEADSMLASLGVSRHGRLTQDQFAVLLLRLESR